MGHRMFRRFTFILCIAVLFSCKGLKTNGPSLENINKVMVFFNYSTNEICLLDVDTGTMVNNYKIDFDIQQYTINKSGYTYKWHYNNDNSTIYLRENHVDDNNRENWSTKIYKIDMNPFELSEIFYSQKDYHNFFVNGAYLYLMSYREPSYGKPNKEQNYIVEYNLLDKSEIVINFNESLPENERICAPYFFITGNEIIMTGWVNVIALTKLYRFGRNSKRMEAIDDMVGSFSVYNNTILYEKNDVNVVVNDFTASIRHKGASLAVYDLVNKTKRILPHNVIAAYLDFIIVDEDKIIYTDKHETIENILSQFWIFPSSERYKNYYIAGITGNTKRLFFSSRDEIKILGVINKR